MLPKNFLLFLNSCSLLLSKPSSELLYEYSTISIMTSKKKMALLTQPGSNVVPIATPRDVWSKIVMLEDLFWKKSPEKIVEAVLPFEFVDRCNDPKI